jgi:CheY-like chemotaxis protein
MAETAQARAENLLTIINDILDFSKIEAGKMELDRADFSLRQTVDEAVTSLAMRAHQKGLELLCDVASDVPDALVGDAGRFRQVLLNLLGNAVKFTDHGEVVVSVTNEGVEAGSTLLHVAITDTGIGIPADKQDVIFDAFSQADGSTTRRFGGTGLGLTICAKLVSMMGGKIWVDSTPGQGSTFHFTTEAGLQPIQAVRKDVSGLVGLTVLVVDDNATNRHIFDRTLRKWQMVPTLADTGLAGVAAMRAARDARTPFDLVLLDVQMPGLDGFDTAEQLRADAGAIAPTIMMLTSSDQMGDAARCRAIGVDSYLVKPVRQAALQDAMLRALAISPSRPVPVKAAQIWSVPREPRNILLAEDNVVNQRVAMGILKKAGHTVTVAQNGREAVEAIARTRFDLVLMDMQMPEMGGAEAMAIVREREREAGGHLPIIALTAHAMKGDRERCLEAGADGYVAKPLSPQDLLSQIDAQTAGAAPRAGHDTAAKHLRLLESVGGDRALLDELIALFRIEGPRQLEALRAGFTAGKPEAVYLAAHTLRGSAGNFGATDLLQSLAVVELSAKHGDLAAAAFATVERDAAALLNSLSPEAQELPCAS